MDNETYLSARSTMSLVPFIFLTSVFPPNFLFFVSSILLFFRLCLGPLLKSMLWSLTISSWSNCRCWCFHQRLNSDFAYSKQHHLRCHNFRVTKIWHLYVLITSYWFNNLINCCNGREQQISKSADVLETVVHVCSW